MGIGEAFKTGVKELLMTARGVPRLTADVDGFPPQASANAEGVLPVGGDLSPARVLAAYRRGIFQWSYPGEPVTWHCPRERFLIDLAKLRVPTNVRKVLRRGDFEIRFDTAFEQVVRFASLAPRKAETASWITAETIACFTALHRMGWAHSSEVWQDGALVGGNYGLALGRVFFGESNFGLVSDAGNVAMAAMQLELQRRGFVASDAQVASDFVARFGGEAWPRPRFLALLEMHAKNAAPAGRWTDAKPLEMTGAEAP